MSSASVEEYLEAIYSIKESGKLAKNQELSKILEVSPPSVTQMIQRLAEEGLVEYQPYKGAYLTGKGMAARAHFYIMNSNYHGKKLMKKLAGWSIASATRQLQHYVKY